MNTDHRATLMQGHDTRNSGRLMFVNGTVVSITGFEFIKEMLEPKILGFFVFSAAITGYLHPFLSKSGMEVWMQIVVVTIGGFIFFSTICAFVALGIGVTKSMKNAAMPITIVILASNITVEIFMSWFIPAIWGHPLIDTYNATFRIVATNQVTYFILEVFFTIYILPSLLEKFFASKELIALNSHAISPNFSTNSAGPLAQIAIVASGAASLLPTPEASQQPVEQTAAALSDNSEPTITPLLRDAHILIGGYRIRIAEISMIKAEEHYIRIFLPNETLLIRFRLSDVAAMIPDSIGTLAHRSYWISYDAVRRTQPVADGRLTIEMRNGQTLIIPRARRKSFEAALRERAESHLSSIG